MTAWMRQIAAAAEQGLRAGVTDGSVRLDVDICAAVPEIIAAGVGTAYGWIVLPPSAPIFNAVSP